MLVIEGLMPLRPGSWREVFSRLLSLSDGQMRFVGWPVCWLGWWRCSVCADPLAHRVAAGKGTGTMPFLTASPAPMSSAWLLPEHIADVLPSQAPHRRIAPQAAGHGAQLWLRAGDAAAAGAPGVPAVRYRQRQRDQDFKLVDQLSGRSLGLRADTTPQVARIDAHLLNRRGVTRLCYCGPVAHAPDGLNTSREPLQFGVEVYGHAGLEADLEVQDWRWMR
jgi:hypothetical protein